MTASCPGSADDAPRWALAFDVQWVEALPVEPHDQPLDGVVSPRKTFARTGENPGDSPIF
jgi:5-formyltetrahydrofolate cyclo-ligase